MSDLRPIVFGKYCLLERVSVGGMAEVYRARPFNAPGFRRFLAVKRILPNLAADEEFITMFVDEAKIAVQLNHRSVCQIYELGRLDGSFYIVMEYIGGKDVLALQNWFRKRRKIMSVAQAAWVAAQVCDGLDYAHRKADDDGEPLNIVHRDISPQNVIVSYEGEVKLIDFGIARAATTNQITQVGVLKGKFGYMSPEQVDAQPIDHRSDVFALGTLLWEMLTARRLFHGETDFATLEQVRNAPIEPPSSRNPHVPEELDRIVLKALERDRDARYQWASDLGDDLRAFLAAASPDYSEGRLASWMIRNFTEDHEAEQQKLVEYARFVRVEDVHDWYLDHPDVRAARAAADADVDGSGRFFDPERHAGMVHDEVLAANRLERIGDAGDPNVSDIDLEISVDEGELAIGDDPMARLAVAPPFDSSALPVPRRRRGGRVAILAILAAVALAAGALLIWNARFAPGTLVVDPRPSEGATISVDGELVAGTAPVVLEGVRPGSHVVEVRVDGYEPVLVPVEIEPRGTSELAPELVPMTAAEGSVTLTVSEPAADVYLDGEPVGGQGVVRTFSAGAGEPHVAEIRAPGFFVEEVEFELTPGGRVARTVEMRPVVGSLTIGSQPAGDVYLDGELIGTTDETLVVSDLDVRFAYDLEIRSRSRSFLDYATTVVFDTYYDQRLRPLLPRWGTDPVVEEVAYGFLVTEDGDRWYRVFIDGRDTGFVTPIPAHEPLAIDAGERTIAFVRAAERREVVVQIPDGETVVVQVPEE